MLDNGIFNHILDIMCWDYRTFKAIFGIKQNTPYEFIRLLNGGM